MHLGISVPNAIFLVQFDHVVSYKNHFKCKTRTGGSALINVANAPQDDRHRRKDGEDENGVEARTEKRPGEAEQSNILHTVNYMVFLGYEFSHIIKSIFYLLP